MRFGNIECSWININDIIIANISQIEMAEKTLYIIDLKFDYNWHERLTYNDIEIRNADYAKLCEEMDKCQK